MVSISKRNKRTSLHQKYKVAKKVRQHHKKAKQALKKQKPKKDKPVSIPMEVPFKDDILKGVEKAKQQEKIIQVKRLTHLNKLRSKGGNGTKDLKPKFVKRTSKSFVSDIKEVLDSSDMIIEVVDARDPNGTRSLEAEKAIKLSNKPFVILVNKIDLVPVDNLNSWLQYLSKDAIAFPFKSSCQEDDQKFKSELKFQNKARPGNVYGADELLNHIKSLLNGPNDMGKSAGKINVGVIGLPNTGKSSVINSLKKKRVCVVGERARVTRELQKIDLNDQITVFDTPAIVLSKGNDLSQLCERNCIEIASIEEPIIGAAYIFDRCSKEHLWNRYAVASDKGFEAFLIGFAQSMSLLKKGGISHCNKAARRFIADWNNGKLAHWSVPPTETDQAVLNDTQKSLISKLASKNLKDCAEFSQVESSGPLSTVITLDELSEDKNCDDEDCDCCDDEDCDCCDDEDCDGCDDEDCDGCGDEDCDDCDDEECHGCDDEECDGCDDDECDMDK